MSPKPPLPIDGPTFQAFLNVSVRMVPSAMSAGRAYPLTFLAFGLPVFGGIEDERQEEFRFVREIFYFKQFRNALDSRWLSSGRYENAMVDYFLLPMTVLMKQDTTGDGQERGNKLELRSPVVVFVMAYSRAEGVSSIEIGKRVFH